MMMRILMMRILMMNSHQIKKWKLKENSNKLNDENNKEKDDPCTLLTRVAREKCQLGDVETAKQFYSASLKVNPTNAELHFEVECL